MQEIDIRPVSNAQKELSLFQNSAKIPEALPTPTPPQEYLPEEETTITQMLTQAQSVIAEVVRQPENEKRPGGCLVIWKKDRETPLIYEVGEMTKPDKYPVFAMAKATLLRDHLPETRLSGENLLRDPKQRYQVQFGDEVFDIPHGAVTTNDGWIISFSGFEQEWDAAAVLAIAVKSGVMEINEARQIARESIPVSPERTIGNCFNKLIPVDPDGLEPSNLPLTP